jgi:BlaI family transcriptional regulator, penicillinase repressor
MRRKSDTLTRQELQIMKIMWQLGTATVRDVYEAIRKQRKLAYTTVMTVMNVLEQKKYLKRRLADRAYVYQVARSRDQVIKGMVKDFVNRVFDGAAEPLLVRLVKDRHLSSEELEKISQMIRESEEGK